MKSHPRDTVVRAWARLTQAQQIVHASIEGTLKAAKLPPLAWYDALLELERAGDRGLRPGELQRQMLLAQYNLSRLIDRVEQAGYAERRACDDDGRGQIIVITAAGRDIRRRMWAVYGPAIQGALGDHLSPKQTETLDALLGKLVESGRGTRPQDSDPSHR